MVCTLYLLFFQISYIVIEQIMHIFFLVKDELLEDNEVIEEIKPDNVSTGCITGIYDLLIRFLNNFIICYSLN